MSDGQMASGESLALVEREELVLVPISTSTTRLSESENGAVSRSPVAFRAKRGDGGVQEIQPESLDGHEST